ncbi:CocE/NonD family hydrolase [Actinoplanes sp. NPDC051513]|uniref:CocE/NonD family hydrolase n=1 Tax=Actinoplanes sp. NPDC051513 TaxID=3363908 RepID=UPI00379F599C
MQRLPLFLRMLMRRARKGPSARYDVRWEPARPVPAADGSPLLTDHYAPLTDEPCPTVLIRAPYIRSGFPFNYLYGALVAEQGYHVILQSSRGTGGSGGEFHPWHNEAGDGQAAVAWLRDQPWFTGDLYTMGASYMAYAQMALALDPPPEWRGAIMQVGLADPHRFFWPGGAFALERSLVGGIGLFGQALRARDYLWAILRMQRHLKRVITQVPLLDVYPAVFGGRRPAFEEWIAHPEPEHWADSDLMPVADKLAVPVSLCTGWWDLAPDQVIEAYTRLRAAGHDPDLLIGPWTHTSALEQGWAEVFGQAMRRLRGEAPADRVRVFVTGAEHWRDLPSWPPAGQEQRWFLGDGTLRLSEGPGSTSFPYDPSHPTPSIGGPLQSRTQGRRDNAVLEARPDVLVFTGEPLLEAVEVMGAVRAEVDASTTAAGGDLFVRLCDVDPAGQSVNVCDGLTRFSAPGRVVVDMGPAGHRFKPGHRLRLQVSGGAHPRFLRNYGTGEPPGPATRMVPTETTVRHTSSLVLPVVG